MRYFFVFCFVFCCFGCSKDAALERHYDGVASLEYKDVPQAQQPNLGKQQSHVSNNQNGLKLSKTGIGDIKIGQTYNKNNFVKTTDENPEVPNCLFAHSKELPNNFSFFVMNDIIMAICLDNMTSQDNTVITTNELIKIGDSEDKVLKSYNSNKLIKKISDYTEQPIYIYWYDDSTEKTGIRYDIEGGKVYQIILGNKESLELMEGCS